MNIKSFGILTAASVMLMSASANANLLFDIYAGGTYGMGGYTLFADSGDISHSSKSYGAILGMDIPMFRVELEYNYLDADAFSMNLALVNAYFKLPTPIAKPYIGVGIGSTFDSKYELTPGTDVDIKDELAYQGMLGLTLDIPVIPFNIDIEGRVLYAPDIYETATDTPDLLQYEGRVKLRYVF
ncbi:MAG: outer membrane beta-barrel protein [Alphaproteobacteria bacterium]|nr:outer membrane beta-barrel protein [Alphaproteobacteria bacterium]